MMPLTFAQPGCSGVIQRVTGRDDVRRHLENLGLIAGEAVTVISELNGSLILQVRDGRIALDRTLAARIFVN